MLEQVDSNEPLNLTRICDFMESYKLRSNINRPRLRGNLSKRKDISTPKGKPISVPLATARELRSDYGQFLSPRPPEIEDTILVASDFDGARAYVQAIVKQINGCRQFGMFDACAVMMRRLAEVLIIDAFEAKKKRVEILDVGNYMMLSGLIGVLLSGRHFKLSRNAPKWLERLKEFGDNAAHSRTYITKEIDIDEFKGSYRNLISELIALADD